MNDDYNNYPISAPSKSEYTPSKRKRNFMVIITFVVLPLFLVCFLLGLIGRAAFNGLKKGWRIRL